MKWVRMLLTTHVVFSSGSNVSFPVWLRKQWATPHHHEHHRRIESGGSLVVSCRAGRVLAAPDTQRDIRNPLDRLLVCGGFPKHITSTVLGAILYSEIILYSPEVYASFHNEHTQRYTQYNMLHMRRRTHERTSAHFGSRCSCVAVAAGLWLDRGVLMRDAFLLTI